jgi:hypothetical protein
LAETQVMAMGFERFSEGSLAFMLLQPVRLDKSQDPPKYCWTKPLRGRLQEESIAYCLTLWFPWAIAA